MVATYDRVSCRAVSYGACVGSTRSGIGALDGDRRQLFYVSRQRPRRRRGRVRYASAASAAYSDGASQC